MIQFEQVTFTYPQTDAKVFTDLDLTLPDGVVSLIGQNATGKSTVLLLGGGRLLPDAGRVVLNGKDTREFKNEKQRDAYAAFIYQNMEFETRDKIGRLLEQVYDQGYHKERKNDFIPELIRVFELEKTLNRRTQDVSKGELQRAILAFSLLYGTPTIMMDEPIFALEDYQKHRSMEYICDYAKRRGVNIYYSLHELDLSQKYSDHLVLFYKNAPPRVGVTAELFKPEIIEKVYEVPFHLLKSKESLFRDMLVRLAGKNAAGEKGN